MKVLIINSVCGIGSTGRICVDLANAYKKNGHEVKIAYGRKRASNDSKSFSYRIGTHIGNYISGLKARLFDNEGFNNTVATKRFLKWADKYNPDFVWLHNLHGYYINIELLFDWIKSRPSMKVKWTLHDCWSFTGHCSHFTISKCEKWKYQCEKCPQICSYPKSWFFDNSKTNYGRKKQLFSNIDNFSIITPSKWLAEIVQESFLKEYDVQVVSNRVNVDVFQHRESNFREQYGLSDKKIVLGVSSFWSESKGFNDFIKLSEMLGKDFAIVMVGLTAKQCKSIPNNVIGIEKNDNPIELSKIYSAADVFVNLTREDNYPTVNLEAQACGTPCVTYRTGGSPESVPAENVCQVGDLDQVLRRIKEICSIS